MGYALGIDYGTNSVRALIVDCADGREVGVAVVPYPSGEQGVILDKENIHLARQSPGDYLFGLETSVRAAIAQAERELAFSSLQVVGIGVDTTGSSPIPIDAQNVPLALSPAWANSVDAQCWLWKDHTSYQEASEITRLASLFRPHYIAKCGNTYSSEWFWAKIWRCLKVSSKVFAAAHSWVELSDWIPSVLAGINDSARIVRGICAAGHKALYSEDWGGLPDEEFLANLDPALAALRGRLYAQAHDASVPAGHLSQQWAAVLGLPVGIPIAIGAFDVHYGAIGSGIEEGVLVKAIGTSTCDCAIVSSETAVADIPGICGIVPGAILPGFYGIEAGQSAVGDIFKWWIEVVCDGDEATYGELTKEATDLRPGQNGLLALDWNNGNRTVLVNPRLTGLIVGQTLHSSPAEVYRALIEATAFGARTIVERLRKFGVPISRIVCCGGIAEKSPLLMQIYADILGLPMEVAASSQACALGAAIAASVLAGIEKGGHASFAAAQHAMTSAPTKSYRPIPANQKPYDQLFQLYLKLHDAFGGVCPVADLSGVMNELLTLKENSQTQK